MTTTPVSIRLTFPTGGDVAPGLVQKVAQAAVFPLLLVQGSTIGTASEGRLLVVIQARAANLPEAKRAAKVAAGAIRPLVSGPVRIVGTLGLDG